MLCGIECFGSDQGSQFHSVGFIHDGVCQETDSQARHMRQFYYPVFIRDLDIE